MMNANNNSLSYTSGRTDSLVSLNPLSIDNASIHLNLLVFIEVYSPRSVATALHLSCGVGNSQIPELVDGAGKCLPRKSRSLDNFTNLIGVDCSICTVVHILRTRRNALICWSIRGSFYPNILVGDVC